MTVGGGRDGAPIGSGIHGSAKIEEKKSRARTLKGQNKNGTDTYTKIPPYDKRFGRFSRGGNPGEEPSLFHDDEEEDFEEKNRLRELCNPP